MDHYLGMSFKRNGWPFPRQLRGLPREWKSVSLIAYLSLSRSSLCVKLFFSFTSLNSVPWISIAKPTNFLRNASLLEAYNIFWRTLEVSGILSTKQSKLAYGRRTRRIIGDGVDNSHKGGMGGSWHTRSKKWSCFFDLHQAFRNQSHRQHNEARRQGDNRGNHHKWQSRQTSQPRFLWRRLKRAFWVYQYHVPYACSSQLTWQLEDDVLESLAQLELLVELNALIVDSNTGWLAWNNVSGGRAGHDGQACLTIFAMRWS